ncbi:MAG TPA: protein-glutamate O-methyltransferase CheR [Desulfatiglandales bacterium]|nr:protein-glutamate O-methyltransferase CheR [Desulfatiglandales bacterium]
MPEIMLEDSDFKKFSRYVHDMCGINLHGGKKELVKARLGKIFRERDFKSLKDYYTHVINDKSGYELIRLLDSISTNLTYFFREPRHFEFLSKIAIPEIMNNKAHLRDNTLRFWSAGCSSGEEAYSIAIALNEAIGNTDKWQIKILATDLSTKVLAIAKTGVYEKEKVKNIPYDLRRSYFQKGYNKFSGYFRIKEKVKKNISFQRVNFMEDFHFAEPFDVIFCRNVMIYFDNSTREILIEKIYKHLIKGGHLFIGHAESLTWIKHHLKYIQPSIYKKV